MQDICQSNIEKYIDGQYDTMIKAIQSYFGEEIHTISFTHVTSATRLLNKAGGYAQTSEDDDTDDDTDDLPDDNSEGMIQGA